jgi:nitroreductase
MQTKSNRRNFLKLSAGIGAGIAFGIPTIGAKGQTEKVPEDFFQIIKKRRSVRKFKSTPIPEEHITKILDAARSAPTSGNQQPWKFVVIQDPIKIDELKKECISKSLSAFKKRKETDEDELDAQRKKVEDYFGGLLAAPVHVVVLTDNKSKWPSYNEKDGALAAGYLILATRALGYGTVFITDSISEQITKKVCNIPDRYTRICFIPVGVPESWPESPAKKDLQEFIVHDSF